MFVIFYVGSLLPVCSWIVFSLGAGRASVVVGENGRHIDKFAEKPARIFCEAFMGVVSYTEKENGRVR